LFKFPKVSLNDFIFLITASPNVSFLDGTTVVVTESSCFGAVGIFSFSLNNPISLSFSIIKSN
jgi:hypothetical protein